MHCICSALAMGCTLLPFALSLVALRQLSAFTTALAVNMEPVYAIVLAIMLLGEQRELIRRSTSASRSSWSSCSCHPLLMRRRARRSSSRSYGRRCSSWSTRSRYERLSLIS